MKILQKSLTVAVLLAPAVLCQDKPTVPFYGNEKCPVMGKKVNKRWNVSHEGQRIYTCCRKCWKAVKKEPARYLTKAYPEKAVKKLKLDKCPMMGKPIKEGSKTVTWQGYQVPVCCKRCIGGFLKEPNKRLTMILNKDVKSVGNKMCPMMPEEAVVADMFILYKKKLINICCDSCVTDAQDDPEKFLKKYLQ